VAGDETRIPRDPADDATADAAAARREFATRRTGASLRHVGSFSLDPATTPGNVEHFIGAAQVPIGLAGPLLVDGEHAKGEFYVPMATTEGTLVASYNRGMKLVRAAGGVKTTVVDDGMQRAPAFIFDDARAARAFGEWLDVHIEEIRAAAEATTSVGRLERIERYPAGPAVFTRFVFTTGDAAGQNMTGKATAAACAWIHESYPGAAIRRFYLESNMATDKKHSQVNTLRTRGKRVVAEVMLPSALVESQMRTTTREMFGARLISNLGGLMAGSVNNGAHSANAIAAIFIATGQDVANVAESQSALVYGELRENGDYTYSITIPSLIVATYGGGTGLATQRECLELLDCYGPGKVRKLAEIIAATVLCGELSLGAAVVANEWVSSHDRLGRNRP